MKIVNDGIIRETELVLDDDYPIYCGYLYVADNYVITSDYTGSAKEFKFEYKINELRNCDFMARMVV